MKNEMSLKAPLKCSVCGRACFNESEKTCCENSHEESLKTNIIIQGDCIEELKRLDENSVDAIITDPPYGIGFMGKKWDSFKPKNIKKIEKKKKDTSWGHIVGANSPALIAGSYDFSLKGKIGFQEWMNKVAIECLRVLKPGGFLLVFGGTRTYHRLVCGIEDAGFEIRDTIMWLYGSGFPKSMDIGKQIDKKPEVLYTLEFKKWLGKQIEKCSKSKKQINDECGFTATSYCKTDGKDYWSSNFPSKEKWIKMKKVIGLSNKYDFIIRNNLKERGFIKPTGNLHKGSGDNIQFSGKQLSDNPISEYAKEWEGWGTALKPACEPIVVARKPLSEKNVALNVLKWGTGGINIDECRIGNEIRKYKGATSLHQSPEGINDGRDLETLKEYNKKAKKIDIITRGRFPANIILDEEAGKMLDIQSGITLSKGGQSYSKTSKIYGKYANDRTTKGCGFGDKGGASRFFYCAKASKSERNFGCEDFEPKAKCEIDKMGGAKCTMKTGSGNERNVAYKNNHPTVKPIKIMEYLIKLVTRKGAVVLDPFIGSGTTAIACLKLGRKYIGIEKEKEYIKIAKARIKPFSIQKKL